jgi:RimJ/RimL family protein N-acetyltransferase
VPGFTTARLHAVPVTEVDVGFFRTLWGDDSVAWGLGALRSGPAVEAAVREATEHWALHGFGRWVLHDGSTAVGTVKLAICDVNGREEVELGYAMLPEFRRRGFATEAASGAVAYARDHTVARDLVALTLPGNDGSIAVLRRLGFENAGDVELAARTWALHRLGIERE